MKGVLGAERGDASGHSPFRFPGGGGEGATGLLPCFLVSNRQPAHGLHPRFVVAEIWANWVGYRGGGDFVGGQVLGENFVFRFGVKIFPKNFSCAIWGTSCSLCILSGGGSQVFNSTLITPFPQTSASFSMESRPGPCPPLFLISDELVSFKIWACPSLTEQIVHKELRVGGVEISRV